MVKGILKKATYKVSEGGARILEWRARSVKVSACPQVSEEAVEYFLKNGYVYQRTKGVFIRLALAYEAKYGKPKILRSGRRVSSGPPVRLCAMRAPDGWDDFRRVHTNARMVGYIPKL